MNLWMDHVMQMQFCNFLRLTHLPLNKIGVISQTIFFQIHFCEWKVLNFG